VIDTKATAGLRQLADDQVARDLNGPLRILYMEGVVLQPLARQVAAAEARRVRSPSPGVSAPHECGGQGFGNRRRSQSSPARSISGSGRRRRHSEASMTDPIETVRKRLRYRSNYTGTKETDLLLGGFARAHLDRLDAAQLAAYEALLAVPDPRLYKWATGQEAPPPEHDTDVLRLIRNFKISAA
jgi:antitoxin CptB